VREALIYAAVALVSATVGVLVGRYLLPNLPEYLEPIVVVRPDSSAIDSMRIVIEDISGRYDSLGAVHRYTKTEKLVAQASVAYLRERLAQLEKDLEGGSQGDLVTVTGDTTLVAEDTTRLQAPDSLYTFTQERRFNASMRYDIALNLFDLTLSMSPSRTFFLRTDTTQVQKPIAERERSRLWHEVLPLASGAIGILGIQEHSVALQVTALVLALVRLGLWVFS
jgi:hypothetical protein